MNSLLMHRSICSSLSLNANLLKQYTSIRLLTRISALKPNPKRCLLSRIPQQQQTLSSLHPQIRLIFTQKFSNNLLKSPNVSTIFNPKSFFSSSPPRMPQDRERNRSIAMFMTAIAVLVLGASYAAVPLYRIYCQVTGTGGHAVADQNINEKVAAMKKVPERRLTIMFDAEKSSRLAWDFQPCQHSIVVSPGETVLAFYSARNQLDHPVNGVATYTILPYEAGKYFNKIQCFCFEEQQLNAGEQVDLPVFFYIDPEYSKDPFLYEMDQIVLSYNFFETKEGFKLPKPDHYRSKLSGAEIAELSARGNSVAA